MKYGWGVVGALLVLFAASVLAANYTVNRDRAFQAICAEQCVRECQSSSLCNWDFINSCSQGCLMEPQAWGAVRNLDPLRDAEKMVKACNECYAKDQCRPLHYDDRLSSVCNAIRAPGRDLEEFFYNFKVHARDDGCPFNATLSVDGKKCVCEGQLDSLHTACLDAKTIKENLKRLVSSIPDDVVELMLEQAPEKIKSLLQLMPRKDGLVQGLDSLVTDIIYENFVRDTSNLRALLNALGPERAAALVRQLESLLKSEAPGPEQPPYTPPAGQPPYYPPTEQPPYQPPGQQPPYQPPQPPVELPPAQPPKGACSFMGTWQWMQGSLKVGRAEVTGSNQGFQASLFNEINNIPSAVGYLSGSFDAKTFTLTGSIAGPYTVRGTLSTSSDCTYFQLVFTGGTGPSGSETSVSILNSIGIAAQYFTFRKGAS